MVTLMDIHTVIHMDIRTRIHLDTHMDFHMGMTGTTITPHDVLIIVHHIITMEDVNPEYINLYILKLRKYMGNRLNDTEIYKLAKDIINRKHYDFPLHCLSEVMVEEGIPTFPEKWVGEFGDIVYDDVINKVYERYIYGNSLSGTKWYTINLEILIRYYEESEEFEKCGYLHSLQTAHYLQNKQTVSIGNNA